MRHARLILPILAASLLSAAPGLNAAPQAEATRPSPEEDKTRAEAKALFAQGSKEYQTGRYAEAIALFEKAYALWKNPTILVNIAISLMESGHTLKAVRTLRAALSQSPVERVEGIKEKLPEKLRKANEEAAELRVEMPEPAEVEVDGSPEGTTPLSLVLLPGTHEVVIKVAGEEKLRKTFELGPGSRSETWSLTAWPETKPPDKTEPHKEDLPKGPGFWKRLQGLQRLPIWYFGAAAALAVVGSATILGTGLRTNTLEDRFLANPTHTTRNEGIRFRSATNAMVGVTVTALVGAAVLALFTNWKDPFGKKERQVELLPQVGQGSGGLVITGQF